MEDAGFETEDGPSVLPHDAGRDRYVYVPKRPSDHLAERRTAARRLGEPPTIAELKRHAERFGVDCVVETAVEAGYREDTLVSFQETIDRIEAAQFRRDHPRRALPKRKPAEERVRILLGIEKKPEAEAEAA